MLGNLRHAAITFVILSLAGVAVTAEKTATVSGTVTDEAGKPLSGVSWWISAFEEWRDGEWEVVYRTGRSRKHTTDENGRFEVTFYGKVRYDLQFDLWGYGPAFLFQIGSDSPELKVKMKKGVLVTGKIEIAGKARPDFDGISVVLRLPNSRGLWFKKSAMVDYTGTFRFYASPPPTPPGPFSRWQLLCAGEVVMLDVDENKPPDEVTFQISTTSRRISSTEEAAASQ
jgi:hypothetical protein